MGRFRRLSKQRNALLKSAQSYRELSYWDQELARLSEQIDQWRESFVNQLKMWQSSYVAHFARIRYRLKVLSRLGKDQAYQSILEKTSNWISSWAIPLAGKTKRIYGLK